MYRGRKRRNAELVKAASQRTLTGAEALRIALGFARYFIYYNLLTNSPA